MNKIKKRVKFCLKLSKNMRLLNIKVPCDQGIIRNAKVYLLKHYLKSVDENDEIIIPYLKQAIFLIK